MINDFPSPPVSPSPHQEPTVLQLASDFDEVLGRVQMYGAADRVRDSWRRLKDALLALPVGSPDRPQEPTLDPELEQMLRELRTLGAKRNEPCGVHHAPQWTCGFCLHNVLERVEESHFRRAAVGQPALRALQHEKKNDDVLSRVDGR